MIYHYVIMYTVDMFVVKMFRRVLHYMLFVYIMIHYCLPVNVIREIVVFRKDLTHSDGYPICSPN